MPDTPERDVRDRLAEALFRSWPGTTKWGQVSIREQDSWRGDARRLLAVLPSVGLTIGRSDVG